MTAPAWQSQLRLLLAILPYGFVLCLPILERLVPVSISWVSITLYDLHRISVSVVLVACIVLSLVANVGRSDIGIRRQVAIIFLTIFFLGAVSLVRNDASLWGGLREIETAALFVMSYFVLQIGWDKSVIPEWRRLVVICLVGSALLYLAIFFESNYDGLFTAEFIGFGVVFPGFSNVRFFGDYQAFLLPFIVLAGAEYCRHPVAQVAGWTMIALFFMVFFFSGTRAVILGQITAHVSLLLLLRARYLKTLKNHVFAWASGWFLYLIVAQLLPMYFLGEESPSIAPLLRNSFSDRAYLWGIAWHDMIANPWLGIGPGQFALHLNSIAAAPHNGILMVGAEWGLIVLLLIAAVFLIHICNMLKSIKSSKGLCGDDDFLIASWISLSALLAHSLVANVLVIPTSQLFLLLAMNMVAVKSVSLDSVSRAWLKGDGFFYRAVSIVVAGLMLFILVHDIPRLPGENKMYHECMRPTQYYSPRFWQQGWLIDECPSLISKPQRLGLEE